MPAPATLTATAAFPRSVKRALTSHGYWATCTSSIVPESWLPATGDRCATVHRLQRPLLGVRSPSCALALPDRRTDTPEYGAAAHGTDYYESRASVTKQLSKACSRTPSVSSRAREPNSTRSTAWLTTS